MRASVLLPIRSLNRLKDLTNYHLVLYQLLGENGAREVFKALRDRGDFLILDNGAHEGERTPITSLLEEAEDLRPDVVVLPDLLEDFESSFFLTLEAILFVSRVGVKGDFRWMVVPHDRSPWGMLGKALAFFAFARRDAELSLFYGLSHDDPWVEEFLRLPKAYRKLIRACLKNLGPIHLLGSPRSPQALKTLAYDLPLVGVDSARPVVAALHGLRWDDPRAEEVRRPPNYFYLDLPEEVWPHVVEWVQFINSLPSEEVP